MERKRSYSSEAKQSKKRVAVEKSDKQLSDRERDISSISTQKSKQSQLDSQSTDSSPLVCSSSETSSSGQSESSCVRNSNSDDKAIPGLDKSDIDFLGKMNYRIIKRSGFGSFGYVYKASHTNSNQIVAIKVLKDGKAYANMTVINKLIDTTYKLMQIEHNNIVVNYCYALNVDIDRRFYIIREFADMSDLYKSLQIKNQSGNYIWCPLDEYQSRHLIKGIASGVRHMHRNGISHSDLKLDNILLFWSNNATQQQKQKKMSDILIHDKYLIYELIPKLTDFDKCKVRETNDPEDKIMATMPRSNLNYASPESYIGIRYDLIKADCYSVGCCLMAMLLASHPIYIPLGVESPSDSESDFKEKRNQYTKRCNQLKMDMSYIRELIKHLSPEVRRVLEKLLDPNSETRITMHQFLADQWFLKTEQSYKT